jgi:hypothetical protein
VARLYIEPTLPKVESAPAMYPSGYTCLATGPNIIWEEPTVLSTASWTTNLLLKNFGNLCKSQRRVEDLTPDECETVPALKERVATAELFLQVFGSWYTFTHGACETDDAGRKIGGVGGVIVSANGTYLQHFGMQIPEDWMQIILQYSSPPVHELEVLSVLISFQVWFHFIRGSQVLHHTDNDSCRFL